MHIIKEHIKSRVEQHLVSYAPDEKGEWVHTYADQQANPYICIRMDSSMALISSINELVEEARRDFPFIKDEDMELVHFGGTRYKGTFGIEFNVPNDTVIPSDYREIENREYTL